MTIAGGPDGVVAEMELGPPAEVHVGRGSAFVIAGHCYHAGERTRRLDVRIGETRKPVEHFRLPRIDVYDRLEQGDPAGPQAFRSGFVALPDLSPQDRADQVELALVMALDGGREVTVPIGSTKLAPALPRPPEAEGVPFPGRPGPSVAICMATYNPPADLLRRQLDSIREQTHGNWVCLISDDNSNEAEFRGLSEAIGGDERFVVSRKDRRLGYYGNFERALSMAPPTAEFVTLCDQDDRWHPGKLERLLEEIGEGQLVYSDARVVTPAEELVHSSYWTARRNNYTNFGSLLLANSITGAASLFRRELLDDALPFPPKHAGPFHDHWLAMVALARGDIVYVDEPLYDYVQHEGAVIGHSGANKRPRPIRQHLAERLRRPGGGSRIVYYYDWYQQMLFAEVLRLRCWERMTPSKRRTLRRLLSADDSLPALAWLLGRRVRRLWGHDETLDRELFYGHALARRRAVSWLTAGRRRPNKLLPRDASIPPDRERA